MDDLSTQLVSQYGLRAIERCHQLSQISELDDGILRQYLTPEHQACNQQVAEWMSEAGMETWQDAVGNQWGRLTSANPNAKRLIIGSHLDTVPYAGAYDGILGVMLGVEVAALAQQNELNLPFHLDIVGFCDEEGTRFATTLIGSKALAGQFDPNWLALQDSQGISMRQAMLDFGLDPEQAAEQGAALSSEEVIGYWEAHIEQGPVLEAHQQPLGVVSAIAGAKRAVIEFIGQAGHAGTTPMNLRQDSLAAAAEFTLAVEQLAKLAAQSSQQGQVATIGSIAAKPGATNVIAGLTELSIDIRAQEDAALVRLVTDIEKAASGITEKRQLTLNWQWTHAAPAVQCDDQIIQLFAKACQQVTDYAAVLPSGAGHDAMAIADICPVGMLFIRSPGGISHHPDEAVIDGDVINALAVLYQSLNTMALNVFSE
ncbi:allantoate amidohydrolase [Thalassotalea euphylliae]|uniref:Allantoate amidohydrolase n=1 Tax=Thalassotalea euphylliae TaxID=1655234 RepID=A0A3E0UH47_9GAMM|nr:allantoate amidohydrolase [Thalassotalea euphylliae]REL36209.1 allantoate amidohydrolase [Thalassotalea euphylliae]